MAKPEPTYSTRLRAANLQRANEEFAVKPLSLMEQFRKVKRRLPIFLAAIIACMLLAAALGLFVKPSYEAKTTLVVHQLPADPNNTATVGQRVDIDTESSIAGSKIVTQEAAERVDAGNASLPSDLRANLQVSGHSQTAIMDIYVTDASAQRAADLANAVAQSYLDQRSENIEKLVEGYQATIESQIDATSSQAAKTALEERQAQIAITSVYPGRIISPAAAPTVAETHGTPIYLLIGLVAGSLIGAFAAFFADRRDPKVSYPDRFEEIANRPVSLVSSANQAEGIRRTLRRIGAPEGDLAAGGINGITIHSNEPRLSSIVYEQLKQVLPAKSVNFATASAFEAIESGSSVKRVIAAKAPLVVETSAKTELSKLMLAAEGTGVIFIIASAESSYKALRDLFEAADFEEGTIIVPVFLT
ncbi:YveK family protein [Rothia sp. ZJ932]|uniref:YveK family protein n=1 Tax=Rothia sp. ZJ932 TaxID=2810516 RepID=UPI0019670160|nr:Wzz/FepE/Etk N-terminal domain-containing protein [Rothia sp. ZJ932]QRZ61177.1 hypothetical protein JR346_07960 [Rothia sp. ZJ932]